MLFLRNFFSKSRIRPVAEAKYREIAAQARDPAFFGRANVPDSIDGRFEMLCLHAFLVFRQLRSVGAADLSQAIYDEMFQDLDAGLRELGAADIGVGRRIKAMTEALNGRIQAYDRALASGREELVAALRRNVYGTVSARDEDVRDLAAYVEAAVSLLQPMRPDEFRRMSLPFPRAAGFFAKNGVEST